MEFIFVGVGLVLLIISGDFLVKGAVSLSLKLGVPALIVSVTIVGFGTSAPEMLIAIQSALNGTPGIALGNVVGSNTANVLLVLGVPALIYALDTGDTDTRRIYMIMMGISVIFVALAFLGPLYIWHGLILLALLAVMLADNFYSAVRCRKASGQTGADVAVAADIEDTDPNMATWKMTSFILAGIIGLPIGAQFMIEGAVVIADRFGLGEEVIGLTLVAIGTSLPELATTVMAAIRRQADVALGNVIGSNMFNLLAIMGVTSFFGPLPVAAEFLQFDLWVMLGSSALIGLFVFTRLSITRMWGIAFLALYVVYIVQLLHR